MSKKLKSIITTAGVVVASLLAFGGNIKTDGFATLPTVEFGQTASAWTDYRYRPNLRKEMQDWAGFCDTNIHNEVKAANKALEKGGHKWRYRINRFGYLYTYGW